MGLAIPAFEFLRAVETEIGSEIDEGKTGREQLVGEARGLALGERGGARILSGTVAVRRASSSSARRWVSP
ncbi:MAG: hypothetical protein LOX97_03985 [Sphingomonas sp.]|nr:hypothetical protein [Sphingomonas sp.]